MSGLSIRALVSSVALAAALAPAPAAASNSVGFSDTRNEGGPDISGVLLSNDDSGILQFKILVPNLANLPRDASITVGFDTDRNASTGAEEGADYLFVAREGSYTLLRWDGRQYLDGDWRDVIATYRSGLDLWIDWENLAKPAGFAFFVRIDRPGALSDRAPDTGTYPFEVKINPQPAALHARFNPEPPRAGRTFTARPTRIQLTTGEFVAVARATCDARLAGHRLKGRGAGGCTWTIPKSAAGKTLVVRLVVPYGGKRIRFVAWDFRVRR